MLLRLLVSNYALIGSAEIEFPKGLTTITGETGAGKSILLGALSLILGQRADTSVLLGKEKKCVVEGEFLLEGNSVQQFFSKNNLDPSSQIILRREINAEGRSRAFINDTPAALNQLKELGSLLVDIHSQHETMSLNEPGFQMEVMDALSGNLQVVSRYQGLFSQYREKCNKLEELKQLEQKSNSEADYFQFLHEELGKAALKDGEQEEHEQQLEMLKHSEQLITGLDAATGALSGGEENLTQKLSSLYSQLRNLEKIFPPISQPLERLHSANIELKDIAEDFEKLLGKIHADPAKMEEITERLELIYQLQTKHRMNTVGALILLKEDLGKKIGNSQSLSEEIRSLEEEIVSLKQALMKMAISLSLSRKKAVPKAEKEMKVLLAQVGMPEAQFVVKFSESEELHPSGKDEIELLFSANKGIAPQDLSRVASGGELSRLVLSVKSLIAKKLDMPTMVFDEIDTGVSGEMAFRVGEMLQNIAKDHQVISITHLPQIASKGDRHLHVYKYVSGNKTVSGIRILNEEERVLELAKMIGGDNPTATVLENAKELLGN